MTCLSYISINDIGICRRFCVTQDFFQIPAQHDGSEQRKGRMTHLGYIDPRLITGWRKKSGLFSRQHLLGLQARTVVCIPGVYLSSSEGVFYSIGQVMPGGIQ